MTTKRDNSQVRVAAGTMRLIERYRKLLIADLKRDTPPPIHTISIYRGMSKNELIEHALGVAIREVEWPRDKRLE
jgi:hypothetical protein